VDTADDLPDKWKELSAVLHERRSIVYTSEKSKDATAELAQEYVERGQDVIVFTMRKEYAEDLSTMVDSSEVIHSDMEDNKRETALRRLEEGDKNVLIGVKMFDEGVDIPDVDVGINAAAEKTQRQLIQRRGRILRREGEYTPVFHQFVIEDEVEYYSNLDSVEPELVEPQSVVEKKLPISIGSVDVWDIYHSLDTETLRRVKKSGDFARDGLTGKEWWLQIYLDMHEDLFYSDLQEKVGYDDPRRFSISLIGMTDSIVKNTGWNDRKKIHGTLYSYFEDHPSEPSVGDYLTLSYFGEHSEGIEESATLSWSSRPDLDAKEIATHLVRTEGLDSAEINNSNLVSVVSDYV